jgi:glycosyltransferase involved in cell wall biosynthesis
LKILFVHTKYYTSDGGEDSALQSEIMLMRRKGHEVEVFLFDNASTINGVSGKLKAAVSSIYNTESAKKIKEAINEFKPDVMHVHNFFFTASPSVLIQAHKQKVPVVVTLHNFRLLCVNTLLLRDNKVCELCVQHDFPWYGVKYKCYHDSAVQSAAVGAMSAVHKWMGTWKNKVDTFISPSHFSRNKFLHSSLHPDPEKIKVKYNFIDDPNHGDAKSRNNYYLFVGRLSQEKGIEVLLDAFIQLPKEEIIIAGDGPLQEQLVTKYAPYKNIIFLGRKPRTEVLELMKKCRVLMFPSICYEGLPLTIAEAFATGTPVIGSSMGAMQEMIINEYNGLLFETGNSVKLAEAILFFNSYLAKKDFSLYDNARKSYLENYHPEKCYNDVMNIYNNAILRSRSGS